MSRHADQRYEEVLFIVCSISMDGRGYAARHDKLYKNDKCIWGYMSIVILTNHINNDNK